MNRFIKFMAVVCGMCIPVSVQAQSPVTIPLYFGGFDSNGAYSSILDDNPGSSTVDPVDPNLVKVELTGSTLSVYENVEGSVEIMIHNHELGKTILYTRFEYSLTIQLTDTATYLIIMSIENLPLVYGKFSYPASISKKEMKNGQLYIRQGNSIYALPGTKVE